MVGSILLGAGVGLFSRKRVGFPSASPIWFPRTDYVSVKGALG